MLPPTFYFVNDWAFFTTENDDKIFLFLALSETKAEKKISAG